jgi:hypothetical protein
MIKNANASLFWYRAKVITPWSSTKEMCKCRKVVIHHRKALLWSSLPPMNRHARMHVQQILRTRHRSTSIVSLLALKLSICTKFPALGREAGSLFDARCAAAPALIHVFQHDHLIIFFSESFSVVCSCVCRAAFTDAGLEDRDEDEHQ